MPKLLWVSPLSVHDTSSSSAMQMRNMLLALKARNVDIIGLSALNFVHESGTSMFSDLDEKLKGEDNSFNLNDNNINFIYMRTASRDINQMSSQEQRAFYAKMCSLISVFKPDVVMGSGADMLSMVCFDEAARRGIPTVYTLLDHVPARFNFPNINVVISDSQAMANLYALERHINVVVTGSFLPIDGPLSIENLVKAASRNEQGQVVIDVKALAPSINQEKRKRITLVNPSLDNGLAIFAKMALSAHKTNDFKDYSFAVVETYAGQFAENIVKISEKTSAKKKFTLNEFKFLEVLSADTPMQEIFDTTKVLVIPRLSFAPLDRFARQAIAHAIPIVGTNTISLAESVGIGATLVTPPAYCVQDFTLAPTKGDVAEFNKAVKEMCAQDPLERCVLSAKNFDVNVSANNLVNVLKPLFALCAGNNPQLLRNGSLI